MLTVISVDAGGPAKRQDLLVPKSKPTKIAFVFGGFIWAGEAGATGCPAALIGFSSVAVVMMDMFLN